MKPLLILATLCALQSVATPALADNVPTNVTFTAPLQTLLGPSGAEVAIEGRQASGQFGAGVDHALRTTSASMSASFGGLFSVSFAPFSRLNGNLEFYFSDPTGNQSWLKTNTSARGTVGYDLLNNSIGTTFKDHEFTLSGQAASGSTIGALLSAPSSATHAAEAHSVQVPTFGVFGPAIGNVTVDSTADMTVRQNSTLRVQSLDGRLRISNATNPSETFTMDFSLPAPGSNPDTCLLQPTPSSFSCLYQAVAFPHAGDWNVQVVRLDLNANVQTRFEVTGHGRATASDVVLGHKIFEATVADESFDDAKSIDAPVRFDTLTDVRRFSVAVVPEPATWALLLAGLVGMAVAGARRRRSC